MNLVEFFLSLPLRKELRGMVFVVNMRLENRSGRMLWLNCWDETKRSNRYTVRTLTQSTDEFRNPDITSSSRRHLVFGCIQTLGHNHWNCNWMPNREYTHATVAGTRMHTIINSALQHPLDRMLDQWMLMWANQRNCGNEWPRGRRYLGSGPINNFHHQCHNRLGLSPRIHISIGPKWYFGDENFIGKCPRQTTSRIRVGFKVARGNDIHVMDMPENLNTKLVSPLFKGIHPFLFDETAFQGSATNTIQRRLWSL